MTSLQRLQALEHNFTSLEAQLSELRKITIQDEHGDAGSDTSHRQRHFRYQGRALWALRWILKNIQGKNNSEQSPCLSPAIWSLLADIVKQIHPLTVAKNLRSNHLVTCLNKTLSEAAIKYELTDHVILRDAFETTLHQPTTVEANAEKENGDLRAGQAVSKKRAAEDDPSVHSAKRLKDVDGHHFNVENPDFQSLINAVAEFLTLIPTLSDHQNHANPLSGAEPAEAAQLLGNWLRSIILLQSNIYSKPSVATLNSLNVLLSVWDSKDLSKAANNPDKTVILCSQECLIPALGILGFEHRTQKLAPKDSQDTEGPVQSFSSVVERFLAKEIIMPAKSTHVTPSQQESTNANQSRSPPHQSSRPFYSPISRYVQENIATQKITNGTNIDTSLHGYQNICTCLAELLSTVLRCTSLTSPKKRKMETPWLETVFLEICSACELDLLNEPNSSLLTLHSQLLDELLSIIQRYQVKLGSHLIRQVALHYCGLYSPNSSDLNWSLLEKIVELHSGTFLANPLRESPDEPAQNLANALFRAISKSHSFSTEFYFTQNDMSSSKVKKVKKAVPFALLKTYAEARMLNAFSLLWHRELCWYYSANNPVGISIWEGCELCNMFSETLSTFMTAKQLLAFVAQRVQDLETFLENSTQQSTLENAMASMVILTAVFNAANRSNDFRVLLISQSRNVFALAFDIWNKAFIHQFHKSTPLWSLLASTHRLWVTDTNSSVDMHDCLLNERTKTLFSITSPVDDTFHEMNGTNEAKLSRYAAAHISRLRCLGSIATDFVRRNYDIFRLIPRHTWGFLIAQYQNLPRNDNARLHLSGKNFNYALAEFPVLLRLHEMNGGLPQQVMELAAKCEVLQGVNPTTPLVPWKGSWSVLIMKSLEDAPWLFQHISNILSEAPLIYQEGDLSLGNIRAIEEFLENLRLQIPSTKIPRNQRKKILKNVVQEVQSAESYLDASGWSRKLSLILHLINPISGFSGQEISFEDVFLISKCLDAFLTGGKFAPGAKSALVRLFKKVAELCVRHELNPSDVKAVPALERSLVYALSSWSHGQHKDLQAQFSVLSVLLEVMAECSNANVESAKILKPRLVEMCGSLCEASKQAWLSEKQSQHDLEHGLGDMKFLMELLSRMPGSVLREHLFSVESVLSIVDRLKEGGESHESAHVSVSIVDVSSTTKEDRNDMEVLAYVLRCRLETIKSQNLEFARTYRLLNRDLSNRSRSVLESTIVEAYCGLEDESRVDFIKDLLQSCRDISSGNLRDNSRDSEFITMEDERSCWDLLQILICGGKKIAENNNSTALIPESCIPETLITLAGSLSGIIDPKLYLKVATIIAAVFKHYRSSKAVSQPAAEAVLSTLTDLPYYPASFSSERGFLPKIYVQLTSIVRSLLIQHRKRLNGRFDLLISTLQALLRPLFRMPGPGTTTTGKSSQVRVSLSWPLNARHAQLFTRLITILCDPSASSTRTSLSAYTKRGPRFLPLTDETRKARKQAGRHVPNLLLTLCDLQLRGRFVAEGVREALIPGIHGMFDVMGSGVLEAVYNAGDEETEQMHGGSGGMPSGVRTVFKAWWEAWKKERERRA